MKKLFPYLVAFVIALFCAATILSPVVAGAETRTITIDDYIVDPFVAGNDIYLRITFGYEDQLLSFYWDDKLDTSRTLYVKLRLGTYIECIDAEYVD